MGGHVVKLGNIFLKGKEIKFKKLAAFESGW